MPPSLSDDQGPQPVDPRAYARIFEGNPDGVAIYEELARVFAQQLYVPDGKGGERETCRRLGRFEVVNFITAKINAANGIEPFQQEEAP